MFGYATLFSAKAQITLIDDKQNVVIVFKSQVSMAHHSRGLSNNQRTSLTQFSHEFIGLIL